MSNYESSRVNSLIPEFLKESSANLVAFLKEYYENEYDKEFFASRTENEEYVDVASSLISNITKNRDLDQVSESAFIEELAQSVAKNIPGSSVVTRKFLIKRLVDYYDVRGNTQMIDAFFRLFFNKAVSVDKPFDRVLIPSSGHYESNLFLRTFNNTNNLPDDTISKRIFQKTERGSIIAQGLVSSIKVNKYDEKITFFKFQERTVTGVFKEGVDVQYEDDNGQIKSIGKPYRTLKSISINKRGTGYKLGDRLFLQDRTDVTFYAKVISVDDDKIKKIQIIDYGSGNTQDPNAITTYVDFANKDASPEEGIITTLDTDGSGSGVEVTLNFGLLIDEDGEYINTDGRLSNHTVLQDSNFYQKFSYELSTDQEFSRYKSFYVELLHPAGEKVFHDTKKNLPTQKLEITNEEITLNTFLPVDVTPDDDDVFFPQTVFLIKQDYFNIDDGGPDLPYVKEDYLQTSKKIIDNSV